MNWVIILGIIIAIIGVVDSGSFIFQTGIAVIFSGIALFLRKKQMEGYSKKLLLLEVISVIVFGYHILFGIISGNWYENPLYFILFPIVAISPWIKLILKKSS